MISPLPDFRVTAEIRVRYAETDQMGVAHHGAYLTWLEVGRTEYCRAAGFTYSDMERDSGILLMVADIHCRYRRPALYDDLIQVQTRAAQVDARMIRFTYCLTNSRRECVAEGDSTHVPVVRGGSRTRIPTPYLQLLLAHAGGAAQAVSR